MRKISPKVLKLQVEAILTTRIEIPVIVPDHLFEVISKLDKKIGVSVFYWNYITTVKHTSISGLEADVRGSLTEPIEIRKRDPSAYLYYGTSKAEPFVCTVVKRLKAS